MKRRQTGSPQMIKCSFCARGQDEVAKLVAGPSNVYICSECIKLCNDILEGELLEENNESLQNFPKPEEIKAHLDEYVIQQDEAKVSLAVAVYNHYKRINQRRVGDDVEVDKSNILMLGSTGTGKTLLAQTLARLLNVPFAIADATTLTEAGYVGEDVENILVRLLQAADYNAQAAEQGIIYIDEIDKIAGTSRGGSGPDVSREGVQRDLLPVVEGTTVTTKHGPVRTDHILFVAAGAFHLSKPSDLIPELQGRFPIRVELDNLDEEHYLRILKETDSSLLKQYQALLAVDGCSLTFGDDGVEAMARTAHELNQKLENIGARRLQTILAQLLDELLFEVPESGTGEVVIDREFVERRLDPVVQDEDLSRYIL
jgi:ATP-dependent Clp protease ATP-binding subunit ClpX